MGTDAPPAKEARLPRGSAARALRLARCLFVSPPRLPDKRLLAGSWARRGAMAGPGRPLPGVNVGASLDVWSKELDATRVLFAGGRQLQRGFINSLRGLPAPSRQPPGGAGCRGCAWRSLWPGARAGPLGTGAGKMESGEVVEGGGAGALFLLGLSCSQRLYSKAQDSLPFIIN